VGILHPVYAGRDGAKYHADDDDRDGFSHFGPNSRSTHYGDCLVGFWSENGSITTVRWAKDRETDMLKEGMEYITYHKIQQACYFRKLPPEIKDTIIDLALTTKNGMIYVFEASSQIFRGKMGQLRFCESKSPPPGYRSDAFEGDPKNLPPHLNAIHLTCKEFRSSRGRELELNHIWCSGWAFDSFITNPSKNNLYDHVRQVTIWGEFVLGHKPETNILHCMIQFAMEHPNATIHVQVHCMHLNDGRSLNKFLTLRYYIREAIRAVTRPTWLGVRSVETVRKWLNGKEPGTLNAPNIEFFPRDHELWDDETDSQKMRQLWSGTGKVRAMLEEGFKSREDFVKLMRLWHTKGITSMTQ
jgi:hypothetical protein